MCVMHLQDSGMREKSMHYLRRKAPSVTLLRELHSEEFKRSACHWPVGSYELWAQFVCCKWRFKKKNKNRERPHYFQAHVFAAWKTEKHMHSCIDTQICVCMCSHISARTCTNAALFWGGMFKPLLAPDQTEFPMKFSVEQKWLELIAADKWPKQIALPLWQGSGESN